jgi:hypothetical protein
MKKPLLILTLFFLLSQLTEAQLWKLKRYEASAGFGPSFFFGDVGGYSIGDNLLGLKDFSFIQTRYDLNFNAKYRILQDVNVRFSLSTGLLKANDKRGSNENRNFEASTFFLEPSLIGEYYFIKNKSENSYLFIKSGKRFLRTLISSLDFYVLGGIGGVSYSVSGNNALEKSANFKSGGFAPIVPVGLGASLIYSPDFNFGVELRGRYALTDYLDGYTSQYSSRNDVYYSLNFIVTYKVRTGKNGLPSFR